MKKIFIKSLKFLKWVGIVAFALIILLIVAIEVFDRYLSSEKGGYWLYRNVNIAQKEIKFSSSGLRYMEIGDPEKPALLLIHGAPGSLLDWVSIAKIEEIYEQYRLVIPERPGYGGTRPRGGEKSVKLQAERISELLDREKLPVTIMGHSYGGPIAVVLGAIKPQKIKQIVGVAGQYDPDNEITFNISHYINFKLFKFILPRFLWVSNVEKLSHPAALRELIPLYKQVQVPVFLIHGDKDSLVPYENSPYVKQLIPSPAELTTVPGGDHPLHMQQPQYLVDFILQKMHNSP